MSKKITVELSQETYDSLKSQIEEKENKLKEKKKVNITINNRFTGEIIYESEKTTYKEAVEEAVKKKADLRRANLREADLRGVDLREADLRGVDLRRADLRRADLREADLRRADLREADLRGVDLRRADLRRADLGEAKFYGKTNSPQILTKKQVPDFLAALGFIIK